MHYYGLNAFQQRFADSLCLGPKYEASTTYRGIVYSKRTNQAGVVCFNIDTNYENGLVRNQYLGGVGFYRFMVASIVILVDSHSKQRKLALYYETESINQGNELVRTRETCINTLEVLVPSGKRLTDRCVMDMAVVAVAEWQEKQKQ